MKLLRTAAFLLAAIVPASALAAALPGRAACCPGPCCAHGCPFCNH